MDLVNVTLNGKPYQVPKGMLVIDALEHAGHVDVPHFCYHPKLKPVGMCRMCVVEVGTPKRGKDGQPILKPDGTPEIGFMPKPQASCTTPVSEGMVVLSDTPEIRKIVQGVVEFFLANHPLDCPVCDKGGECPLQDQTFKFGPGASRVAEHWGGDVRLHQGIYQVKRHFQKPFPLGDLIMLDRERCIQCGRCVRFQDDIAHDHVLAFEARGFRMEIVSYSDPVFDSRFSGNTVDICPVGALTDRVFRFKARAWELTNTPSVCNQCGCGCNMYFGHRINDIARVIPRQNEPINEIWICDRGRFGHEFIGHADRITDPMIRKDGQLQKATWDEAFAQIVDRLKDIQSQHGGSAIGGLASPKLTLEDNTVFVKMMRDVLGTDNIDYRTDPKIRHILRRNDDLYEQVEQSDVLLLIGANPLEELPILDLRLKKAVYQKGATLVTVNPRRIELDKLGSRPLIHPVGMDVNVLNALTKALIDKGLPAEGSTRPGLDSLKPSLESKVSPGVDADAIASAADAIAGSKKLIVLMGERTGDAARQAATNIALLVGRGDAVHILANEANSLGALASECLPKSAGLTLDGMLNAASSKRLRAMYILANDPMSGFPDADLVRSGLEALDFLVVQDLFLNETARLAHVVLPGASYAEKDGRLLNFAGTPQTIRAALKPLGNSRPDWQILSELSALLGAEFRYRTIGEVVRDIAPLDGNEQTGNPSFAPAAAPPPVSDAGHAGYPFALLTGALLYDGGQSLTHCERLSRLVNRPFVEISRDDAKQLGIAGGDDVEVVSPKGSVRVTARVTRDLPAGTVFVPNKCPGVNANKLLDITQSIQRVNVIKRS